MNPRVFSKKCKSYPVASVAAAVTILLILAIYLRGTANADLQQRFEEATRSWKSMEENVFKNSVNLETHLESAKAVTQDVEERLIRPAQLAQNYQYFYRLEASTGIKIQNLQQQALASQEAPQNGSKERGKKPPPLFSKVQYGMNLTGDFTQILEILHALEHGPHFYQLNTFSLQRANDPARRDITVTMSFHLLGRP